MIRKFILLISICTNFLGISQELNLDNNLTTIITNSNTSQLGLTFTGENSFNKNDWDISSNTNYTLSFSPTLSENELMERISLDYKSQKWFGFTSYQYNYSYVRKINSDNWIGIGCGYKHNFNNFKTSISYALVYQNTDYLINPTQSIFRHSIRFKIKFEKSKYQFSSEYYFQPSFMDFNNYIFYGTTKINLFPDKKLNFTIQDVFNYRSKSGVKIIHNLTIGIGYKLTKKFDSKLKQKNP